MLSNSLSDTYKSGPVFIRILIASLGNNSSPWISKRMVQNKLEEGRTGLHLQPGLVTSYAQRAQRYTR